MLSDQSRSRVTGRSAVLVLLALSCLVYANTLLNGFTIDDGFAYADNHFVKHLGNLRHFFSHRYFVYSNEASYRPVCTFTYFVDAALWRGWAGGPHLTNVVLYAAIVAVLFGLFREVTGNSRCAFLGAALFAVHPIHTEVVNGIAFREDLLIALFLPLGWLLFRRSRAGAPWLWLPIAWLCFLLALFSKEMAVIFPVLVAVLAIACRAGSNAARQRSADIAYAVGLAVCTLLFLLVRFRWMQFEGEAAQPRLGGSLAATILADVKIQAYYLKLFTWPLRLTALYPPGMYSPGIDARFFASLGMLALVCVGLIAWRGSRILLAGVLWWFVSLAPVANVYPIFNPMAERYLFFPSVGLCLWAGWAIHRALCGTYRRPVAVAATGVLVLFAITAVLRNPVWRSNRTLWRATSEAVPGNPIVMGNLASAHYEEGDYARALDTGIEALRLARAGRGKLDPTPVRLVVSSAHFMLGDRDSALSELQAAESGLPCRFDVDTAVYRNLGLLYDERGELTAALGYYRKAVEIDPFRPDLWRKISFCELRLGQVEQAKGDWERARKLDPAIPVFPEIVSLYEQSTRDIE